ncbi:MAG: methyltransferase domain-containing protein [bacterium]
MLNSSKCDPVNFSTIASIYENFSLVQKSAADILIKLLEIKEEDDVLDLGCGTGNLTYKIKEITKGSVVGVDPSEEMINKALKKNNPEITFRVGNAEALTFTSEFDVIFCNSAFQWFSHPEEALKRCYAALKKNGRIGIQAPAKKVYCPNFLKAMERVKEAPETKAIFANFKPLWIFFETKAEYNELFERAGFKTAFSKIESIKIEYTPEEVFRIFSSGAIAGYLNQDFYGIELSIEYMDNFRKIVRDAFIEQANNQGKVELIFNRIFLVAMKE